MVMPYSIALDISRLIYTAWHRTPVGISRVELAYAEHFIDTVPDRLHFVVRDALGRLRVLDRRHAIAFVGQLRRFWQFETGTTAAYRRIAMRALWLHIRLLLSPKGSLSSLIDGIVNRWVYICVSQLSLAKPATIVELRQRKSLKVLCAVHDILPIEYPQYFPAGAESGYRARLESTARHADIVMTNSQATATGFRRGFCGPGHSPVIVVAPLGVEDRAEADRRDVTDHPPYFVMLGTIEPRKNHLLILRLWRSLGENAPRLVIIGKRGWRNQATFDLLDRSVAPGGQVEEHDRLSDDEVRRMLSGARALLMPSFAEGFGLPIAEALASGVPVLCSDIAVFREVGGDAPEFIDPRDDAAWRAAIIDYAAPQSRRRAAQLARLKAHVPVRWPEHFRRISQSLATLTQPAVA
jgi:glycosyltransferase involved in cell wall biosynthesis